MNIARNALQVYNRGPVVKSSVSLFQGGATDGTSRGGGKRSQQSLQAE